MISLDFTQERNKTIIGQQGLILKEDIMLLLLTQIIAFMIGILLLVVGITSVILHPQPIHWSFTGLIFIVLGLILLILGILRNIHRSKITIGAINRAEFYGVVTVMVGIFMYMNTRIDQIYQIIYNLPK